MTFTARVETYVNVSSLTTPFNFTLTKPTGTVDGDILFTFICIGNGTLNPPATLDSVPANWNLIATRLVSTYYRFYLYWHVASGEGASYVWSLTATNKVHAVCSCYTGGDFNATNPIDNYSDTEYIGNDAILRATSFNVAKANSPLFFIGGVYHTSSRTFTKPTVPTSNWVEDDDAGSTTPDWWSTACSMTWAGSSGTGNIDATISAADTQKHAFAVSLTPLATPTNITVSDGVGLIDGIGKERRFSVSDSLGASDGLPKTDKNLSTLDVLYLLDGLLKQRNVAPIPDFASLIDSVLKERLLQAIQDTVMLGEDVIRDKPSLSIDDVVSLIDEIYVDFGATQVLVSDIMQLMDEIYKTRDTIIEDTFTLTDLPLKTRNLSPILDILTLSDILYTDKPSIIVLDTLISIDSILTDKTLTINEQIHLIDTALTQVLGKGWPGKIRGIIRFQKIAGVRKDKIKRVAKMPP